MPQMRAKLYVQSVERFGEGERLQFAAVTAGKFDSQGVDEDNTFSKYTPQASLEMFVTNPELLGQFTKGQTFYVDFTLVPHANPFVSGDR